MGKKIDENSSKEELLNALIDVFNMREALKSFIDFYNMSTEDLLYIYRCETEPPEEDYYA